jgi:cytochrome c5
VNMRVVIRICLVALLATLAAAAAQNQVTQQQTVKSKTAAATQPADESSEGEKRFETHCGRCHVPPENLSPREVKAVLRQMRVRANLSAEDERLILKYLAP